MIQSVPARSVLLAVGALLALLAGSRAILQIGRQPTYARATGQQEPDRAVEARFTFADAEAAFQRQWQRATEFAFANASKRISDVDMWDIFAPFYSCPEMERIGRPLDGGKWICAMDRLLRHENCAVFSFGSQGEASFEAGILERHPNCAVHTYDHTLGGRQVARVLAVEGVTLHRTGICSEKQMDQLNSGRNRFTTVLRAMRDNGIEWLDVLKIDVEGYEWPVFAELLESDEPIPITQVLIEVHAARINNFLEELPDAWSSRRVGLRAFFSGMQRKGFRAFSAEPNLRAYPVSVQEFSFIQVDPSTGQFKTGKST